MVLAFKHCSTYVLGIKAKVIIELLLRSICISNTAHVRSHTKFQLILPMNQTSPQSNVELGPPQY